MKQALDTRTKLLTRSPWPLMLELSIPAVLGMVVVGLYNMMDSIFVGQLVGDVQMGAVSVSYPFTLINAGSAAMLGVGSASVLSGRATSISSRKASVSGCSTSSKNSLTTPCLICAGRYQPEISAPFSPISRAPIEGNFFTSSTVQTTVRACG